jgi:hypothetical protein
MTKWPFPGGEGSSKLRPIGFWRNEVVPDLPHPGDWVDATWDAAERARIVDYLTRGAFAGGQAGFSYCRLCDPDGRVSDNGTREYSDGMWFWPEGFVHYVRDHGVRPPREFVTWALAHHEEASTRPPQDLRRPARGRARPIATQAAIDALLAGADAVSVREGNWPERREEMLAWVRQHSPVEEGLEQPPAAVHPIEKVQVSHSEPRRSGGRSEIEALGRVLRIRESPNRRDLVADEDGGDGGRHGWSSDVRIVLEGRQSTTIHVACKGRLVDCVEWAWAADVVDRTALLRWVDGMGLPQQLEKLEEEDARAARRASAGVAWRAAAPPCLRGLLGTGGWPDCDGRRAWNALLAAYGTRSAALVVLLRWLGATASTGETDCESAIIELLDQGQLRRTLQVLEQEDLDDMALQGLGRLVAFWALGRRPGAATEIVSAPLRERLLELARRNPFGITQDALIGALS